MHELKAEMPSMSASAYTSSLISAEQLFGGAQGFNLDRRVVHEVYNPPKAASGGLVPKKESQMPSARIVKVFIADPNDNIPLDKRVLYTGPEKLTDMDDNELFFEVNITDLLGKHNSLRLNTVDKKKSEQFGKEIFLEPARIRDLKMVVVTVAQF